MTYIIGYLSACLRRILKIINTFYYYFFYYFSVADREESDYMEANIPVGELDKQKVIILKYITCISTP